MAAIKVFPTASDGVILPYGTENQRMMGNDEITFFFKRLPDSFFGTIETQQNSGAFRFDISGNQSAIVIFFLKFKRCICLPGAE